MTTDTELFWYIQSAVREGVEPFRPQNMTVSYEYDIDANEYKFRVEIEYRSEVNVTTHGINAFELERDPIESVKKLSEDILDTLRNSPHIAPGAHILLGEN